jgi:hypothetical protein
MSFGAPSLLHHPRSVMRVRVNRRQVRQLNRSTSGSYARPKVVVWCSGSRAVKYQTLRVPARVVMLGPPYPLISPMSRVRI